MVDIISRQFYITLRLHINLFSIQDDFGQLVFMLMCALTAVGMSAYWERRYQEAIIDDPYRVTSTVRASRR